MKTAVRLADMALRVLGHRAPFDQHVAERKAAYERERQAKAREKQAAQPTAC